MFTQTAAMLKSICNGVQTNLPYLRLRSLLLYSTAIKSSEDQPPHLIEEYLEESAAAAAKKVSSLKSPETLKSVVNSLRELGMSESQIKSVVNSNKGFQSVTIEALAPKIRAFQDLGFSGSAIGAVFASNPKILTTRLDTYIKPMVEVLRLILGSDEDVVEAIKRSFLWISPNVQDIMLANLKLLKSYDMSDERIRKLVVKFPMSLTCEPGKLEVVLKTVEEQIGIHRYSRMFLHGIHAVSSCSKKALELRFQIFKSYGWEQEDITTMVRNLPNCLNMSETKIKTVLDFYMKELGYAPGYLASHPTLLTLSMDNRVLPRRALWEALKEKKLIKTKCALYTVLNISHAMFMENYVMPFKDELPELCEAFLKKPSLSSSGR